MQTPMVFGTTVGNDLFAVLLLAMHGPETPSLYQPASKQQCFFGGGLSGEGLGEGWQHTT